MGELRGDVVDAPGSPAAPAGRRLRLVAAAVPASIFAGSFAVLMLRAEAPAWAYLALTLPTSLVVVAVAWPRSGQQRTGVEHRVDAPPPRVPAREIGAASAESEDPGALARRRAA